jgi:hypothetical protein
VPIDAGFALISFAAPIAVLDPIVLPGALQACGPFLLVLQATATPDRVVRLTCFETAGSKQAGERRDERSAKPAAGTGNGEHTGQTVKRDGIHRFLTSFALVARKRLQSGRWARPAASQERHDSVLQRALDNSR